jgi:hypothetical protein
MPVTSQPPLDITRSLSQQQQIGESVIREEKVLLSLSLLSLSLYLDVGNLLRGEKISLEERAQKRDKTDADV